MYHHASDHRGSGSEAQAVTGVTVRVDSESARVTGTTASGTLGLRPGPSLMIMILTLGLGTSY